MTLPTLYTLHATFQQRFANSMGKWQTLGLAIACLSLVIERDPRHSRLAEALPELGCYPTVKQRLKRWWSNPRWSVTQACYDWIAWVWQMSQLPRPILLVDETKLADRFGVMMVSLAFDGRAIPLMWRCYLANDAAAYPSQGQVLLIYGLLAHVLSALPDAVRPLVEMDRGLGHSAAMLRALKRLQVDFLVRVKLTGNFTPRSGHTRPLKDWVRRGQAFSLRGHLFSRDHAVYGTICLIWEEAQSEAWCLFTNVPQLIGHHYALRWWQEQSFKDLKSGGWHWQSSRLRCPERMSRLVLVMAIAYGWMLSLGSRVWSLPPGEQRWVGGSEQLKKMSLFRLGQRWFKHWQHTDPDRLPVELQLVPRGRTWPALC